MHYKMKEHFEHLKSIWWRSDDSLMTLWWPSDDSLMTLWWHSDDAVMALLCLYYDDYHDRWLMTLRWLCYKFLMTLQWLSDNLLMTLWSVVKLALWTPLFKVKRRSTFLKFLIKESSLKYSSTSLITGHLVEYWEMNWRHCVVIVCIWFK